MKDTFKISIKYTVIILMIYLFLYLLSSSPIDENNSTIIDVPVCAELIVNNNLKWMSEREKYEVKIQLSNMRNDIYKKQIRNMLAENDGLRTIISGHPKLKRLIQEK